jgi:hypothetical protein
MSVFGLFNIMSAHFPWFLICLSMLMGGSPVPVCRREEGKETERERGSEGERGREWERGL